MCNYKQKTIDKVLKLNNWDWICPSCYEEYSNVPLIENEEDTENLTQIHCEYGCGYIFIEDHINGLEEYLRDE